MTSKEATLFIYILQAVAYVVGFSLIIYHSRKIYKANEKTTELLKRETEIVNTLFREEVQKMEDVVK